jgi:hypothetical protein
LPGGTGKPTRSLCQDRCPRRNSNHSPPEQNVVSRVVTPRLPVGPYDPPAYKPVSQPISHSTYFNSEDRGTMFHRNGDTCLQGVNQKDYNLNTHRRANSKKVLYAVDGWCTMIQAGRSRVRFPMRSSDFLIHLILPAALWP